MDELLCKLYLIRAVIFSLKAKELAGQKRTSNPRVQEIEIEDRHSKPFLDMSKFDDPVLLSQWGAGQGGIFLG